MLDCFCEDTTQPLFPFLFLSKERFLSYDADHDTTSLTITLTKGIGFTNPQNNDWLALQLAATQYHCNELEVKFKYKQLTTAYQTGPIAWSSSPHK